MRTIWLVGFYGTSMHDIGQVMSFRREGAALIGWMGNEKFIILTFEVVIPTHDEYALHSGIVWHNFEILFDQFL